MAFDSRSRRAGVRRAASAMTSVVVALLVAACGSNATDESQSAQGGTSVAAAEQRPDGAEPGLPLSIPNQGGDLEGHGPRGFAGSGTGLFAGDELNPNFPDGDGIQIWLTFDLAPGTPVPTSAVLSSEALSTRGDPFDALGMLQAEPVTYDEFEPALFDLAPDGALVECARTGETGIECDVTDAAVAAIADGADRIQLRLKFAQLTDRDGEPDLARFFRTDPNVNEPGLLTLQLS